MPHDSTAVVIRHASAEIAMPKQRRGTSRKEQQAAAEQLAIAALSFIAGEPEPVSYTHLTLPTIYSV